MACAEVSLAILLGRQENCNCNNCHSFKCLGLNKGWSVVSTNLVVKNRRSVRKDADDGANESKNRATACGCRKGRAEGSKLDNMDWFAGDSD